MQPDSPYRKPDLVLAHLGELDAGQDMLDDLLEDHQDWARAYLVGERPLPGGVRTVGVGITAHWTDDRTTGRPALHVLIDHPGTTWGSLPTLTARGLPIVYEVVGEITPVTSPRQGIRPAPGGVSIAPVARNYSGTLGCVVQANGVRYILSCNHVLADCNQLPRGAAISQPSVEDGGRPSDVIANLSYFVPLVFGGGLNPTNAAIAAVAPGVTVDSRILRGSGAMQALTAPVLSPMAGLGVQKSGRTTGDTQGAVRSVGLMVKISFAQAGVATLSNLFSVVGTAEARFSVPGDSGALVTTVSANQPVGMVLAVSTGGTPTTYASPMFDILAALTEQVGAPVTVAYA